MAGLFDFLGLADRQGVGLPSARGFDMSDYRQPETSLDPSQFAAMFAAPDTGLDGPDPLSPEHRGLFGQLGNPKSRARHGIGSFLGNLGDMLLVGNGVGPIYGPRQRQKKLGVALSSFLGPNSGLDVIAQEDPDAAVKLWAAMQKEAPEIPAGVREFQYYQEHPEQQPAFEKYLKLTHPGYQTPITLEAGDEMLPPAGAPPQVTGPSPEAINHLVTHPELAPQFDQKYGAGMARRYMGLPDAR